MKCVYKVILCMVMVSLGAVPLRAAQAAQDLQPGDEFAELIGKIDTILNELRCVCEVSDEMHNALQEHLCFLEHSRYMLNFFADGLSQRDVQTACDVLAALEQIRDNADCVDGNRSCVSAPCGGFCNDSEC